MLLETRNKALITISDEHAHLVDLFGLLDDLILQKTASKKQVGSVLNDLYKSAAEHFDHEEALMIEQGYGKFIDHQNHHQKTLEALKDKIERYNAGEADIAAVKEFIKDQMLSHMKLYDDGLILLLSK